MNEKYLIYFFGEPVPEQIYAKSLTDAWEFAEDNYEDVKDVVKSKFQDE